jgi:hypothetical protein
MLFFLIYICETLREWALCFNMYSILTILDIYLYVSTRYMKMAFFRDRRLELVRVSFSVALDIYIHLNS